MSIAPPGPSHHPFPRWITPFVAACALAITACSSRPPAPSSNNSPAGTPALSIDSPGPRHTILASLPSGGWSLSFDRVEGGTSVYLTATRPDPQFMHTQALVEQRIDSTVPTSRSCRVFLRLADFAAPPGDYHLAAQAPAR